MGAYGMLSQGRLDAGSLRYQAVNGVGAGLLAVSALSADNWPSFAANFVWMLIAVTSSLRAPRDLARVLVERGRAVRARVASLYGRGPARATGMTRHVRRLTS
ncbi:MAG: hypothetical protein QOK15_1268 [Nocardioidaceae bacterium]|jgi:hypothetical protein|nr:hypothetical protein [Nocardioidaceae bacterium]